MNNEKECICKVCKPFKDQPEIKYVNKQSEIERLEKENADLKKSYARNIEALTGQISNDLLSEIKKHPTALPYICELRKEIESLNQELKKKDQIIEKAEKVIEFYGNDLHWKETERDDYECGTATICHSDYTIENCSWSGGKRARQYFQDKNKE